MDNNTEKIWKEFSTKLKQFILKRVSDKDDAEDILQEVFMKIHSNIGTLRDKSKIQSWIYTITRNTIIDYYRSQKPMLELPETLLETLPVKEDPIKSDVIKEVSQCIKTLVNYLPDKYRKALILTEYQGLIQKKMGEKLGLSPSGAKSRVQRARAKLKEMLLQGCHRQLEQIGIPVDYQTECHCCCPNVSNNVK